MTQTAVEWLLEQLNTEEIYVPFQIIEQAKQMEKEQKEEEYKRGWEESKSTAIKYVEEFTTRLQNETNSNPNQIPPPPTPPASRFLKEGKEPPKRNQLK